MEIHKGLSRMVVVLPRLGLVFKFPRILLGASFRMHVTLLVKRDWNVLEAMWRIPLEAHEGFRSMLFKGLVANWMEFWMWVSGSNPFLQPTYFSLFGFVNVQRYGTPCLLDVRNLWSQLHDLTEGKVREDGHHFSNPKNFTIEGGVLRIVDYGSSRTRNVVVQYGHRIAAQFNPAYERNARKK